MEHLIKFISILTVVNGREKGAASTAGGAGEGRATGKRDYI